MPSPPAGQAAPKTPESHSQSNAEEERERLLQRAGEGRRFRDVPCKRTRTARDASDVHCEDARASPSATTSLSRSCRGVGNLTVGQIEDAALADAAEKLQRLVRDGVRRFTPEFHACAIEVNSLRTESSKPDAPEVASSTGADTCSTSDLTRPGTAQADAASKTADIREDSPTLLALPLLAQRPASGS
ncbi:hypothetical protein ACCO45_007828 [Purpureocillium lilacinum]|uniref:Uncharacterized protein n=1 Tax=Purpureocillium lilacinum TaxID=33203 RepID=A0ACC4DLI8_PURLI